MFHIYLSNVLTYKTMTSQQKLPNSYRLFSCSFVACARRNKNEERCRVYQ